MQVLELKLMRQQDDIREGGRFFLSQFNFRSVDLGLAELATPTAQRRPPDERFACKSSVAVFGFCGSEYNQTVDIRNALCSGGMF